MRMQKNYTDLGYWTSKRVKSETFCRVVFDTFHSSAGSRSSAALSAGWSMAPVLVLPRGVQAGIEVCLCPMCINV
jgi:hypothetical protein